MEYVLYDIKGDELVPLIKEIDYLQNYIEIEKLRFEKIDVSINIESNIDDVKVPLYYSLLWLKTPLSTEVLIIKTLK